MSSFFRKIIGIVLIVLGALALLTPFTPGSWLIFIGLGFLGFRLVSEDGKLSLSELKKKLKNKLSRILKFRFRK